MTDHDSNERTATTTTSSDTTKSPATSISTVTTAAAAAATTLDSSSHTPAELQLLSRITSLERQLREQTALLARLRTTRTTASSASSPSTCVSTDDTVAQPSPPVAAPPGGNRSRSRSRSPRRARAFNPAAYTTRHIALKFAYLGSRYGGFEHANGNVTPQPTVEEVLWKALRKGRLISPEVRPGADESVNVLWGAEERRRVYAQEDRGGGAGDAKSEPNDTAKHSPPRVRRLELNWDGCQYSKCGRTDRGVSAFGQVVGIRVRSNRPVEKKKRGTMTTTTKEEEEEDAARELGENGGNGDTNTDTNTEAEPLPEEGDMSMPAIDSEDLATETYKKEFDPVADELPYISLLNALLPPDIRVLAWCPSPPANFDARFSCRERRYKYFFTNPAFCPTPGPLGLLRGGDGRARAREGWLDVERMKIAANKLEGVHDFRNFCKIDASKQMSSCVRRITYCDVVEWDGSGRAVVEHEGLSQRDGGVVDPVLGNETGGLLQQTQAGEPKVYAFCVHGTAFLWHQVRCMVAVLFLVGQGLEDPSIVDELLDVQKHPGRPMYEMADDAPLVLWDCIFPDKDPDEPAVEEMVDSLHWLYAGDERTVPSLLKSPAKNDGKFGVGAVVDELWTQWREAKMQEILAGSLLDLAISQGDQSPFHRGVTTRDGSSRSAGVRSQKVFDGSARARLQGRYVPVMKKPRMESLEVLNAKWLKGRNGRRAREETDATEGA
ncbi:tRNA pseudouridine(38-40) synthase [Cladophialophora carrionii CBS 160.54]|uniref:tRNA pseudouridine(38-40) synthase n=1 Tax=Cladophialophora carrionii CBS 160.54 TaxID=1279043 RepID=V9DI64_9EURO|nr:tRNA pseudouridine(38-40) synthase [Cladophialophora carrionii CBS 160.54]ETI25647.1 tRNA pseudouridine(38-40) synthase [Cladophialophora carrionii CBS 160.54]